MPLSSIYNKAFMVPASAIDENGHVNNVVYVQWMQDIAVEHYTALGGLGPTQAIGAAWVVSSHRIKYLLPAFAGEEIEVRTWVETLRRATSLRQYEFVRRPDNKTLVTGESEWVFVDVKTGRPRQIPPEISHLLTNQ